MSHVHGAGCDHGGSEIDLEAMKLELLTTSFGIELAPKFTSNIKALASANFDAYKVKVAAAAPVYLERSILAKSVPDFWLKSLDNCNQLAPQIAASDRECLKHLVDVQIIHQADPRDFSLTFEFSAKNPFFSQTTLTKNFTVKPPKGSAFPVSGEFDLEADLYSDTCEITWTSADHNLVKKAPRVKIEELEEYDDFNGVGSFFNWFAEGGVDGYGLGENFLEWWTHATEYAAGLVELENDDDDDDEDALDDEEAADIDIESEDEKPKKKRSKKA